MGLTEKTSSDIAVPFCTGTSLEPDGCAAALFPSTAARLDTSRNDSSIDLDCGGARRGFSTHRATVYLITSAVHGAITLESCIARYLHTILNLVYLI
jgi:hypothetical protein